jgi:DNA-binding phage protein
MPLTKTFKETVAERASTDQDFRLALLTEGIDLLFSGDLATGKVVLRDYVNATIGFEKLAAATGIGAKSLMRMLGPDGNPYAENLLKVIEALLAHEGVELAVEAVKTEERVA